MYTLYEPCPIRFANYYFICKTTMSDFQSLLSVFQDATGSAPSSKNNNNNAAATAASSRSSDGVAQKAPSSSSPVNNVNQHQHLHDNVDLESTTDPNFSSSTMKERIERLLRVRQIRKSTASACNRSSSSRMADDNNITSSSSFHLAICATIVDNFPHEQLWKRWMTPTTIDINIIGNDNNTRKIDCSAELYVHAKHPEHVTSSYLKSKLLPFSHVPNWNDVRVIRAMLSLLRQALADDDHHDDNSNDNNGGGGGDNNGGKKKKATHVLFCTESCIPIATLGEVAKSILLNEICVWKEREQKEGEGKVADEVVGEQTEKQQPAVNKQQQNHREPNWDRSYIHCYNQNSSQCTRFDEHNCWSTLSNSIPSSSIYKALPGWCLLSRKHAESILHLCEKELGGMNLWPAFERVWAPEEVYFPTVMSLCGFLDNYNENDDGINNNNINNEVLNRSLTYSEWDTRASNHKDRAHPLTYDDKFDYKLVRRVRNETGALFLRKLKRGLDLNVWEDIVVRREKKSVVVLGGGHHHRGHRDYRQQNDRRHHYDSRRSNFSYGNGSYSRDRDDRRRPFDRDREGSSSKRHRWR